MHPGKVLYYVIEHGHYAIDGSVDAMVHRYTSNAPKGRIHCEKLEQFEDEYRKSNLSGHPHGAEIYQRVKARLNELRPIEDFFVPDLSYFMKFYYDTS